MLFERKKYKKFARQQLKSRWGIPVAITIISGIILAIFSIPELVETFRTLGQIDISAINWEEPQSVSIFVNKVTSTNTSTLLTYIQIAVQAVLAIAGLNVYLKMSRSPEPVHLSDFFDGLNNWWRGIFGVFWMYIWTVLWTLLFIIPGIVKSISYSQTLFIVAEYKNVSIPKALRISKLITRGYKADIFVMMLSFIGWAILASIPAGLGWIFLKPYSHMSFINAYHAMMKDALEKGIIKIEDLQND